MDIRARTVQAQSNPSNAGTEQQHRDRARKAGLSEHALSAIESGNIAGDRDRAIIAFVDACVGGVKVPRQTYDDLAAIYSDGQLAELILLVGHYMMTARFVETLEVDLDEQPTSWTKLS